jgi:glycosyltransferase involved in cell wall biosynthesis
MDKKQKVLIVHNFYQISGGEDTVVSNEMGMLKENGHDVILYSRHNNEIKNMTVIRKILLLFETIFSFRTYKEVKKLITENKINLVHVHNTSPLISPSVYYACFKENIPVVQTIHNFRLICPKATLVRDNRICEDCIEKGLNCAIKYKCYKNSRFTTLAAVLTLKIHRIANTYNKIDAYIALTKFNKDKLCKLVKDKDKIYVKPNFMKNKDLDQSDRKILNYFVFVGRIDSLKGINLLVDAWLEIKDTVLYIIGNGPEYKALELKIKECNIKNIKLLGFLPKDEIFVILRNAMSLIVPSQWYEGFPMTIVESFSIGVPVLAGDIGNLSNIVTNGVNGIHFNYNSKEDLIDKVNFLIENYDLCRELSKGAYKTFKEKYTDNINYNILIELYNNLTKGDNDG